MTIWTAVAPLLVLLGLGAIHFGYFRRNCNRDSQQFIALADLGFRTARGSACFGQTDNWPLENGKRIAGIYEVVDPANDKRQANVKLFDPVIDRIANALGKRLILKDDTSLPSGRYIDTLVCQGDLLVEGDCVFLGPVKVGGDLIVTGNAAFLKPLTIAGHTRIQGVVLVASGLVAKGEVSVEGSLRIGERSREGWLSASDVHVDGRVFLNGHINSVGPAIAMPTAGPTQRSAVAAIVLALLAYVVSNPLAVLAMQHIAGLTCQTDLATLSCDYPRQAAGPGLGYATFALATATILLASQKWLRSALIYPFLMMMGLLSAGTLAYDLLVNRQIVEEARIINDTMNVLGIAILASFVLTFILTRRSRLSMTHVSIAIAASFGAKIVALVVFGLFRETIMGATELLMLFFIYTFGAFSVHLMALCGNLRHLDMATVQAPAKPTVKARAKRSGTVDGLRGIAILLVVIYHYVPTHFFSFSLGKPINSILFVVAGFFFAALTLKHRAALEAPFAIRMRTLRDLLIKRHIRIWPALAVVVGFYIALSAVDHGVLTQQIRSTWPYYLTYLGYMPRWAYEAEAFPSHLWVISAQETLIITFCAVLAFVGLKRAQTGLWALVAIGIASRLIGTAWLMPTHTSMALESPLAVLDPIALGMIVRFGLDRTMMRSRLRRRLVLALVSTTALWIILPNWNMTYFTFAPLIAALATALVMTLSADEVRGRQVAASGLSSPWLVFLGQISFSLFLLHPLVNTVLRLSYTSVSGVEMPWWALIIVGPAISIGMATLFARHVELPLHTLSSRYGRTPKARASSPVLAPLVVQSVKAKPENQYISAIDVDMVSPNTQNAAAA